MVRVVQAEGPGVRPLQAWNGDFCLPERGDTKVEIFLDIVDFETSDGAFEWLADLGDVTGSGQEIPDESPSGRPDCANTARQPKAP